MIKKIFAKDIGDCDECPIFCNDCKGSWSSDSNGQPIEPPCCSWKPNDLITENMYSCYEPTEEELQRIKEKNDKKRISEKEQKLKYEIEKHKNIVQKITKGEYKHVERKDRGCYGEYYLCPYCHQWTPIFYKKSHDGITETDCIKCGLTILYSDLLEEEINNNRRK